MEITKSFFLPEEYKENFYVEDFLEIEDGYKLIIYEKKSNIPKVLIGKKTVSNGFCNSVEVIHPIKRWRASYDPNGSTLQTNRNY